MSKPSISTIADLIDRALQTVPAGRRRRVYAWVSRIGAVAGLLGMGLSLLDVDELLGVPVAPVVAGCLLVSALANRLARANVASTDDEAVVRRGSSMLLTFDETKGDGGTAS